MSRHRSAAEGAGPAAAAPQPDQTLLIGTVVTLDCGKTAVTAEIAGYDTIDKTYTLKLEGRAAPQSGFKRTKKWRVQSVPPPSKKQKAASAGSKPTEEAAAPAKAAAPPAAPPPAPAKAAAPPAASPTPASQRPPDVAVGRLLKKLRCSITAKSVQSLDKAVTATELNWIDAALDDEDATVVAYVLAASSSVAKLWLYGNDISDEGAKALAAGVAASGSLVELNLYDNPIGDEGAKALAAGVAASDSLALKTLVVDDEIDMHAGLVAACKSKGVSLLNPSRGIVTCNRGGGVWTRNSIRNY